MEIQPVTNNSAICIAGAHRSGTSMVTQLLHLSGLSLGSPSDWMPARFDNPDGFWENLHFVGINDELLNQVGAAWDVPPPASAEFKDEALEPTCRKAQLQIEKFAATRVWGWKDPRNCLTLRFWQTLLPELKVVLVVRNPLEVAYSMRRRNGTSYSFGLRLWEIYNCRLLQAIAPESLLITHYDAFFDDPARELRRLISFAGLPSFGVADATPVVTGKKRHTRFSIEQLIDAGAAAEVIELYQNLVARSIERVVTDLVHPEPGEILPGASSRLNLAVPDGEDVRRELAWLRGSEMMHREQLARRDGQIYALQQNIQRQEQHRAIVERQLTQVRHQLEQTKQELNRSKRQLQTTQAKLGHTMDQLLGELRRQLEAIRKLTWLLKETGKAASRLRTSRRWKISNPFAALRELLGGRQLPGYGHLEKLLSDYTSWRSKHPEFDNIDARLQSLTSMPSTLPPNLTWNYRNEVATGEPPIPARRIRFPVFDQVDVSIIVPVFNQVRFTKSCLGSIRDHQEEHRFEVILIDDCSTDESMEKLREIAGLVYLRNETNTGFVSSCNRGASHARGKYLVFLNNDTFVTAGWLSALLETFEFEPKAGVVGSQLLYPDGRLQEAGGIIWRDGSGWNRGKFNDAQKPEFNYLREVDYCSAACLMIPKAVFEKVGGFDTRYVPAYYEDTDLAFAVRAAGFKVLYQPLSRIFHFEGATGGTNLYAGAKKYQEINRSAFVAKWAKALASKPANGDVTALEHLEGDRKRILVIDHHLPMPDRDSGSVRMFQILQILQQLGHRVTFIPDNLSDIPPYGDALRKRGIELVLRPYCKSVGEYLRSYGSTLDVVLLSRCGTAHKHMAEVRLHAPQSRIIFDTVDLHSLRTAREAALTRDIRSTILARDTQEQEYGVIDGADETWVVSEAERELVLRNSPGKRIEVVSNIIEIREPKTPYSGRSDFLFIGSFLHPPNVDAVLFFVNEIYSLILRRMSTAKFYVVGDKAPPEVVALGSESIIITGLVPDVRPLFDSIRLSVAPLRFGAGVKGKINQSMAWGVPVVATSLAIEGMSLTANEDVLVADEPAAFAEAVIELYQSEEMWNRLSRAGLEKTRSHYSPEVARLQLGRLFTDGKKAKPIEQSPK